MREEVRAGHTPGFELENPANVVLCDVEMAYVIYVEENRDRAEVAPVAKWPWRAGRGGLRTPGDAQGRPASRSAAAPRPV